MQNQILSKMIKLTASLFLLLTLFLGVSINYTAASPIHCDWGVVDEQSGAINDSLLSEKEKSDPEYTIQCGPNQQWTGIRSQSRYSNTNGRYVNYSRPNAVLIEVE